MLLCLKMISPHLFTYPKNVWKHQLSLKTQGCEIELYNYLMGFDKLMINTKPVFFAGKQTKRFPQHGMVKRMWLWLLAEKHQKGMHNLFQQCDSPFGHGNKDSRSKNIDHVFFHQFRRKICWHQQIQHSTSNDTWDVQGSVDVRHDVVGTCWNIFKTNKWQTNNKKCQHVVLMSFTSKKNSGRISPGLCSWMTSYLSFWPDAQNCVFCLYLVSAEI